MPKFKQFHRQCPIALITKHVHYYGITPGKKNHPRSIAQSPIPFPQYCHNVCPYYHGVPMVILMVVFLLSPLLCSSHSFKLINKPYVTFFQNSLYKQMI